MNVIDLINGLTRLGVTLTIEGDELHLEAPAGAMTDELRAALVEHKQAVIEYTKRRALISTRILEARDKAHQKFGHRIDWERDSVASRAAENALDGAMTAFVAGSCELEAVQDAWRDYIQSLIIDEHNLFAHRDPQLSLL